MGWDRVGHERLGDETYRDMMEGRIRQVQKEEQVRVLEMGADTQACYRRQDT